MVTSQEEEVTDCWFNTTVGEEIFFIPTEWVTSKGSSQLKIKVSFRNDKYHKKNTIGYLDIIQKYLFSKKHIFVQNTVIDISFMYNNKYLTLIRRPTTFHTMG